MDCDDFVGLVGSLLLLYAPARDQIGRWNVLTSTWRADKSQSFGSVWSVSATTHEKERNSFSFADSLTMAIGAICLAISFWL